MAATATKYRVTYVDRWIPSAIHFPYPISKKQLRKAMGFAFPMRCPKCRQYTRQDEIKGKRRLCHACGTTFTKREARKAA